MAVPLTVTPGYDFATTEVPTREKLGLAMTGMSLTGIGASLFPSGTTYITITDTSQVTLPFEGMLWVDSRTNLWGLTRRGMVIVRRSAGGWETNRFLMHADGGGAVVPPGEALRFNNPVAGDTNESNCVMGRYTSNDADPALPVALSTDTVGSGTFARVVFKGRARLFAPDFLPTGALALKLYRRTAFTPFWVGEDFYANGAEIGLSGESAETDPDGNVDTCFAYFLGPHIRRGI